MTKARSKAKPAKHHPNPSAAWSGKRRGRYRRGIAKAFGSESVEWTDVDEALFAKLRDNSQVSNPEARETLARRAVELDRQLRELDGRVHTILEARVAVQATKQFRDTLGALGLIQLRDDEPGDLLGPVEVAVCT